MNFFGSTSRVLAILHVSAHSERETEELERKRVGGPMERLHLGPNWLRKTDLRPMETAGEGDMKGGAMQQRRSKHRQNKHRLGVWKMRPWLRRAWIARAHAFL